MEKRVLMIAYHYPPCRGSSGIQRTLSFSRYLPRYGWKPLVLTAHPRAYQEVGNSQLQDVPDTVLVRRAFAFDTARHLAIKGRYLKGFALPDRWVSWLCGAVPVGLRLISQYRPCVIWSTYPIATAHLIAAILHRLTAIPWVADFRDPMTEINPISQRRAPADPWVWRVRSWIERLTVQSCTRAVFAAPGALRIYAERYPEIPQNRWALIANGYDEEQFAAAEHFSVRPPAHGDRLVLLHSGILYPTPDRDPRAFFEALAKLRQSGHIAAENLLIILRASGHEEHYQQLLRQWRIEDLISLQPSLPYREALAEMLHADGLLLFQGYTSNPAIPAKLYEYWRARRPIFAMVDAAGDTAQALRRAGTGMIVPLTSSEEIAEGFQRFLAQLRGEGASVLDAQAIQAYSREQKTRELAALFSSLEKRPLSSLGTDERRGVDRHA